MTLDMRREDTLRFVVAVPDTLLWSAARPVRCRLLLKTQYEGRYGESTSPCRSDSARRRCATAG